MTKKNDPEILKALTDQLELGMSRKDACSIAGISFETFCDWMGNPESEFSDLVEKAEAKCRQRCIGIIQKAGITNWTAAAWWLERKYPNEYGQRSRHELTGPNGGPIPIQAVKRIDLSGLSTPQLENLYRALTSEKPAVLEGPPPAAPPAPTTEELADGQP